MTNYKNREDHGEESVIRGKTSQPTKPRWTKPSLRVLPLPSGTLAGGATNNDGMGNHS
jgi:hypothetical protein